MTCDILQEICLLVFTKTNQCCLETISPQHQTIFILTDMEDFSYAEPVDALKVPIGTINSRLARAREQMKAALQFSGELLPAPYTNVCVAC